MKHIRAVGSCLKYFNVTFALLMIIVLSLNIDQILHGNRSEDLDKISIKNSSLKQDIDTCRQCQHDILQTINSINIEGALLSAVLAAYCLVYAFKNDMFRLHYAWLVPGCLVATILTCAYFIIVLTTHIPSGCSQLDVTWNCDLDFEYNMDHKFIPLTILMVVCLPQFVARSFSILFEKCFKIEKKSNCDTWYMVEMDPDLVQTKPFKRKNYELNSDLKPDNEQLLVHTSPIIFGFRELPVDCPNEEYSSNLPKINLICEDYLIEQEIISDDSKTKTGQSRRVFVRNSSLSTISEEKTFASMNELSNYNLGKVEEVSPSTLVFSVLNEFQNKALFMNEIIHVFQPSSKDGCFNRNVPIRFTSPFKTKRSMSSLGSPVSIRSMSSGSPCSNDFDISTNMEKSLILSNLLLAKKIRFVKRLKSRIEAKKGRKLNYKQEFKTTHKSPSRKTNLNKKRKFFSFNSSKEIKMNGHINHGLSPERDYQEFKQVVPKNDIKPVFF